jgi:sulfur carrier protein
MDVLVNGEVTAVPEATSLGDLLRQLAGAGTLSGGKVAVELNLAVVKRADLDGTRLNPGDRIEIVAFVGGG